MEQHASSYMRGKFSFCKPVVKMTTHVVPVGTPVTSATAWLFRSAASAGDSISDRHNPLFNFTTCRSLVSIFSDSDGDVCGHV